MMTLYERLHKKYKKRLVSHKQIRKEWKKRKEALEDVGIVVPKEDDTSYFQYEIIEQSLLMKQRFEEVFFDTYVNMFDYWHDLTYQERKKQMNIEIHKLLQHSTSFLYNDKTVYMPCFDESFNNLYSNEIVLLDLKQYHAFIRNFSRELKYDYYGVLPFLHGFSSATVMASHEQDFVLYHPLPNRFYLYKQGIFHTSLSFDPKKREQREELLHEIADALLQDNEDDIIHYILENDIVSKRFMKKIVKYQKHKLKVAHKQQVKKEKKKKQE